MKLFVRIICLLLALVMVGSLISAVFASEIESSARSARREMPYQWYANPLYPDEPALEKAAIRKGAIRTQNSESYLTVDEAVAYLRQQMVERAEYIHVAFSCEPAALEAYGNDVLAFLVDMVFRHTGSPKEGDYLMLHFGGCGASGNVYSQNGLDHYALDIQAAYYTSAEQEQELDVAVANLIKSISKDGKTAYDLVCEIYQYMTKNIRYDFENLNNPEYRLKFSAYAAMVDGTAVCQGYAALLYRLLLEMDIDNRCIRGYAGESHVWNIVELDGVYYLADATWDEGVDPSCYGYFLGGMDQFADHVPSEEYTTAAFLAEYPISQEGYVPEEHELHVHSYNVTVVDATCGEAGYTAYICDCGDTLVEEIPALEHVFGEWTVTQMPSCQENGAEARTCTLCGEAEVRGLNMLSHDFQNGSCTRCGDADPDYVEPTEPEKPAENPFSDVNDNDYFLNPVLWAVDNGITAGTGNGNFSPNATCTRGQVVTFLWRAVGQPEPNTTENPFADVSESDYFYKPVLWALENGVTSGTGGGNFSPNNPCTRDQVVTFLWRAMGKPAPNATEHPFSDVPDNAYFFQPVLWALENGITSGTSATTFAPSNPCTRGQVVTFLYRAMN